MCFVTLLITTILELVYRGITGELFVVENFDLYHFVLNVFLIQSGWIENTYSFNGSSDALMGKF